MIDTALALVRSQLDAALQKAAPRAGGWVILCNLVDADGRVLRASKNKVVMALANISPVASVSVQNLPSAGQAAAAPPLDLSVLFFANFSGPHYAEGLTAIARTIDYFHATPVFNHASAPALDPAIDRLTMTPVNLDLPTLAGVMAMLGVHYLPSVCYALRLSRK